MYAKSFLALDSNGRLTGARTVQAAPYAHYTCHLCGSAQCHHDYYGERYCTHCQTGGFSIPRTTQEEICEF